MEEVISRLEALIRSGYELDNDTFFENGEFVFITLPQTAIKNKEVQNYLISLLKESWQHTPILTDTEAFEGGHYEKATTNEEKLSLPAILIEHKNCKETYLTDFGYFFCLEPLYKDNQKGIWGCIHHHRANRNDFWDLRLDNKTIALAVCVEISRGYFSRNIDINKVIDLATKKPEEYKVYKKKMDELLKNESTKTSREALSVIFDKLVLDKFYFPERLRKKN